MERPEIHALTTGYLASLDLALRALPDAEREQLVADVRQHISDAYGELDLLDEAAARTVLEHLGLPEAIAAEALATREEPPGKRRRRWSPLRLGVASGAIAVVGVGIVGIVGVATGRPIRQVVITGRPPTRVVQISPSTGRPIIIRNGAPIVPNLIGLPDGDAIADLQSAGLHVKISGRGGGLSPGVITGQSPLPGAAVEPGSTVALTVQAAWTSPSSTTTTTYAAPSGSTTTVP